MPKAYGPLGDRTKRAVRHQVPEESTQSTVYVTVSLPKNLCQKTGLWRLNLLIIFQIFQFHPPPHVSNFLRHNKSDMSEPLVYDTKC